MKTMWFIPAVVLVAVQALASTAEATVSSSRVQPVLHLDFESIIGGRPPSNDNSWPWMVSIQVDDNHVCGGTLIDSKWILTAAHCKHQILSSPNVTLVLGVNSLKEADSRYKVEILKNNFRLFPHKDHRTPDQLSNDIMLIELINTNITSNEGVMPISLPSSKESKPHPTSSSCFVAGWGYALHSQCSPLWKAEVNRILSPYFRRVLLVNNLETCMKRCFEDSACHAIYYDHTARSRCHRCFIVTNTNAQSHVQEGSIVYRLRRNCTRCAACADLWAEYVDYKANGHDITQVPQANTAIDCRLRCSRHPNCTGVDYNQQNAPRTRCYMSTTHTNHLRLQPQTNFTHFQLIRGSRVEVESDNFRQELRQANMPIVSINDCQRMYDGRTGPHHLIDSNNMLCAGYQSGIRDTCYGDSGGPLMCKPRESEGPWILYGVVNGGPSYCGEPNKVTIFASVSGHLDWIRSVMANPNGSYSQLDAVCLTASKPDTRCIREDENLCRLLPNGNYQACDSCTKYYSCTNGTIRAIECERHDNQRSGLLKWDQNMLRCVEISNTCDESCDRLKILSRMILSRLRAYRHMRNGRSKLTSTDE